MKIHLENEKAINCSECKWTTCEYPTQISKPKDIKENKCMKADANFKCGKCGCSWKSHRLESKMYKVITVSKCKDPDDIAKIREQTQLENELKELADSIQKKQVKLLGQIQQAHAAKRKLKEIALNPDPLPLEEYIDLLIASEKGDPKEGFRGRIEQLEQIKQVRNIWQEVLTENNFDAKAGMPDVTSILENEGIDFESLVNGSNYEWETPKSMIQTFKDVFRRLGKGQKKTMK